MKHIEYVLLTALTGAITVGLGTMMWPALSNLGTIFTQITQALQVKP
jgi:Flp pilus assembly pilin Flp